MVAPRNPDLTETPDRGGQRCILLLPIDDRRKMFGTI
jgi:hypothetical protein